MNLLFTTTLLIGLQPLGNCCDHLGKSDCCSKPISCVLKADDPAPMPKPTATCNCGTLCFCWFLCPYLCCDK